jgi:hypothetical protein
MRIAAYGSILDDPSLRGSIPAIVSSLSRRGDNVDMALIRSRV